MTTALAASTDSPTTATSSRPATTAGDSRPERINTQPPQARAAGQFQPGHPNPSFKRVKIARRSWVTFGRRLTSRELPQLRQTMESLTWSRVIGLFDPTWPRAGLFEGRKALELVRPCLKNRIEELDLPFAAVATDLHSGEEILLDRGPTLEAVRASAALPGVFTPQLLAGRALIDGGLVNPVPVSVARQLGANFVIAVSLYPIPANSINGPMVVANAALPGRPHDMGILDILAQSSALVQTRIAASRLRDDPPDALIVPPTAAVGLFELQRASEVIEAGRRAGREAVPAIREALESVSVVPPSSSHISYNLRSTTLTVDKSRLH